MRNEAGYTLTELLVAAALATLLTALTCRGLADARTAIEVTTGRADLQQRARVALDVLASRIRGAGAGPDRGAAIGRLIRSAVPIRPGRPGMHPGEFSTAVTVFEALVSVPPATLAFDAASGAAALDFDYVPGCAPPCGFFERMMLAVVDGRGDFDVFLITAVNGASAAVRRVGVGTGASYRRGTPALPVDLRIYYLNERSRELRVFDGDRSDLPVVNDVVEVAFEYLIERADGALDQLTAAMLQDGPWQGTGSEPFDGDLVRIRALRLTLRLQATDAAHRGSDLRWFRNPGTAVEASRLVKDITVITTITPPNLGAWR